MKIKKQNYRKNMSIAFHSILEISEVQYQKNIVFQQNKISKIIKMPRQNKLTIDAAVAILMEFSDHFGRDKLPNYSDGVWQQLSKRS